MLISLLKTLIVENDKNQMVFVECTGCARPCAGAWEGGALENRQDMNAGSATY